MWESHAKTSHMLLPQSTSRTAFESESQTRCSSSLQCLTVYVSYSPDHRLVIQPGSYLRHTVHLPICVFLLPHRCPFLDCAVGCWASSL